MKTKQQIQDEITTLKAIKPTVRRCSAFGDDHHAAIDAQVTVLERRMSEEAMWDMFDSAADNIRDAAQEAVYWMTGEEDETTSENWKSLVR